MSDKLVICSGPIDDDYVGRDHTADFCNITEMTWPEVNKKSKLYREVILVNNYTDRISAIRLKTFANTYGFEFDYLFKPSFYTNTANNKVIKDNQVLFVGCSHTYGMGHSSPETVYTHYFSDTIGISPLVDAHPGEGNWLTEEKLNTYNLKDRTVIVQFTDINRIYLNGKSKMGHGMPKVESEVFSDAVLSSIFYALVKRIVNLLRANDSKFLMFQLSHSVLFNEEVTLCLSEYPEFCRIQPFNLDTGDRGDHFGSISHKNIANHLHALFSKLYPDSVA